MDVRGVSAAAQAYGLSRPDRVQSSQPARQHEVEVLKRALESQRDPTEELLRLLEPKGKVIDIRV